MDAGFEMRDAPSYDAGWLRLSSRGQVVGEAGVSSAIPARSSGVVAAAQLFHAASPSASVG